MRIELTIDHLSNQKLPVNYQYLISSWIYKTLHESDADFADWLHTQGFTSKGKRYKHFCFSMLQPQFYKIHKKEKVFELVEAPTKLVLSFNINKAAKDMIKGLFQNNMVEFRSGESFNMLGMINQVQLQKPPTFKEKMQLKTLTPICISVGSENKKYLTYLSPKDDGYEEAFINNLVDKANAYLEEERYSSAQVGFKLLSESVKPKLWTVKKTGYKGYLFDFELSAPKELMEIGYYAGFGVMNSSLGMGFCEEVVEKDVTE